MSTYELPSPDAILEGIKAEVAKRATEIAGELKTNFLSQLNQNPVSDDLSFALYAKLDRSDYPEAVEIALRQFGPKWVGNRLEDETGFYCVALRPAEDVNVGEYLLTSDPTS